MNTPIEKVHTSQRLIHVCGKYGIETLGELLSKSNAELLDLEGLGRGMLVEVQKLRDKCFPRYDTAFRQQWVKTSEFLPPIDGDTSEQVICYNGTYFIARYDRFKGWATDGKIIDNVTHWMKIPPI